jgi:microsomal epoxide hydrolase
MDAPTPFEIAVPEARLQHIRAGLRAADITYAPPGSGWAYGVDAAYLRELVDYWLDTYDWRRSSASASTTSTCASSTSGARADAARS